MSSSSDRERSGLGIREYLRRDLADAGEDQAVADALASLLAEESPASQFQGLPRSTFEALRPEMARRAALELRSRVLWRVLPALLPLPFVLMYAGYVLQVLYTPIAAMFSPDVAGYIAAVHIMLLSLLFGATYAAIPMMLARSESSPPMTVAATLG